MNGFKIALLSFVATIGVFALADAARANVDAPGAHSIVTGNVAAAF